LVRAAHEVGRKYYGSPRVLRELRAQGVRLGRNRVIRLMREQGLKARVRRRFKATTDSHHSLPVAPNLLDQDFRADQPNQRWVGDTTELLLPEGRIFLAAILDLYSRFVVGWALSATNDRHLVLRALDMALCRRDPDAGLLHHSDRGCTYASEDYQKLLSERGITCSMSRRGNCYDNAAMESWNSTFKCELGERFESHEDAQAKVFDYIEVFYNQKRIHSSLDYVSPGQFERQSKQRAA
jgi:transposase InsO family protein